MDRGMTGYDIVYIARDGDSGPLYLQSAHVDSADEIEPLICELAKDPALWREWNPLVVDVSTSNIEERDWPHA